MTKGKTQACSKTSSPSAKRWRGRTRKIETGAAAAQSYVRCRPQFKVEKLDAAEDGRAFLVFVPFKVTVIMYICKGWHCFL